jgi:hypothetical protein
METEFLNLGLDIIGLGVFNYEFGSITKESPVIKAVYGVLKGEFKAFASDAPYDDQTLRVLDCTAVLLRAYVCCDYADFTALCAVCQV